MTTHINLVKQIEKKYDIILASQSIRRQQLLGCIGFKFKLAEKIEIDESAPNNLDYLEAVEYIALKKANAIKHKITKTQLIITCDTVVVYNNKIMGKPKSREEAVAFLKTLSGHKHEVVSGCCIMDINKFITFHDITSVWFDNITDNDIAYYVNKYKPFDKAGAYGIQEWIGMIGISQIEGSYFNVMGLPTHKLYKELGNFLQTM